MRKLFLFWLLLFPLCIFCHELNYEEPQEVAATEGLPSSLVGRSVCAISGEYTDAVMDIVLPGPEPLVIQRTYSSFGSGNSWSFNHYEKLFLYDAVYEGIPIHLITLRQPSGSHLDYIFEKKGEYQKLKKASYELKTPKGLTNGATILSGKTNIKNQKVHYYRYEDKIESVSGAGNRKTFEQIGKTEEDGWPILGQIAEEKVNGSIYRYLGRGKGIMGISKIYCENKTTLNSFRDHVLI